MRFSNIVKISVVFFSMATFAQETDIEISTTHDPMRAFMLSAEDVAAEYAKFDPNVSYSNTTVLERADANSPTGLAYRFAVDRRIPPQRAAQHASEAEVWAIVGGKGAITTGGHIVDTVENGEITGRRIVDGTVHQVSAGDFLVIPEGVPHQVTEFDPEVLIVTFEFPR
jgi:mannose-6-phosphate isomerase-like protein (cupin superfamily)